MPLSTPAESVPEQPTARGPNDWAERCQPAATGHPRVLAWQARREFGPLLYGYPADAQVCCASHPRNLTTPSH